MVLFRAAPRRGPILNGAALAPYKRFGATPQNLGAGRIHFARAFKKTGTQTDWFVWALEKPKEMDGEILILS